MDDDDADATSCLEALRDQRISAQDLLAAYHGKVQSCTLVVATTTIPPGATPAAGGALCGLPVSLKDNIVCAGTPTGCGTVAGQQDQAGHHGALVERLVAAGAVPFVKSNVPQMLMLPETVNRVFGRTVHPTHHDRTCGGSSGGEAVLVALKLSPLGFGTDIGGSIRIPAAFCGIYGFKPCPGRLPLGTDDSGIRHEAIPTCSGPLARSARDIALAMSALVPDWTPTTKPLRWGYWSSAAFFEPCATAVRAVEEAASSLLQRGADIRKVEAPDLQAAARLYFGLLSAEGGMQAFRAGLGDERPVSEYRQLLLLSRIPTCLRPALAWLLRCMGQHRPADLLLHTGRISVFRYLQLLQQRRTMQRQWRDWMQRQQLDVLLLPATALPAFLHGGSSELTPACVYTFWANLVQCAAGVVPWTTVQANECRYTSQHDDRWTQAAARTMAGAAGLPVGVQVMSVQDEQCVQAMAELRGWTPPGACSAPSAKTHA